MLAVLPLATGRPPAVPSTTTRSIPALPAWALLALTSCVPIHAQEGGPTVRVGRPVLVTGDLPDVSHAEPHMAVNPTDPDHLLAAVAVFPEGAAHYIDALVSFDRGTTWERSTLPGLDETESLDPWVAFHADGTAVVTVLLDDHRLANPDGVSPAGVAVYRSQDGGRSWRGPSMVPYGLGSSYDQQKVGADHSDGPHRGRLYVAGSRWGPRTRPGDRPTQALGVVSTGNALTFAGPREISANNINKTSVQPVVLADGTLVLLYEEWGLLDDYARTDLLWAIHSTDGGETYSHPFLVSAWTSLGFADAATASTGPWSRRVFASWLEDVEPVPVRAPATEFRQDAARLLRVGYSDERGMAWSRPVDVVRTPDGVRLIVHRVAADGQGNVLVAWVEDRHEGDRACHRWLGRASSDGGGRFGPPRQIGEDACHALPGDATMFTMGHEVAPLLPRFGRGGDYFGLVGFPEGGFGILHVVAEDGVLRPWYVPLAVEGGPAGDG